MPESRETPRRTIAAEAQLKRSGAISYVVNAYDLSEHGCKIEFVERPRLGETVWVKFEGLEALRSTVRELDARKLLDHFLSRPDQVGGGHSSAVMD